MTTYRLPLFPLQVVLLPGQRLPLHIFEERYKIMIGECIEVDALFGVVLVGEGGIHKIGCAARITQVLEKFPDGRMNILTLGEQRFEVFRVYDTRPYFEGEVSDFHDEEGDDPTELCRMVWKALEKSGSAPRNLPEELLEDPFRLSFAVAEVLRLPLREKQSFLGVAISRMAPEAIARISQQRESFQIRHHRLRKIRSQKRTLKPSSG